MILLKCDIIERKLGSKIHFKIRFCDRDQLKFQVYKFLGYEEVESKDGIKMKMESYKKMESCFSF
jgi:hypothetical protein